MNIPSSPDVLVSASIAWFYLVTNSLRGFTYLPQIVVVWRSHDGARSLSLLTWSAWLVAHVTAVLYGLVLHDPFFTTISLINCVGCATVVSIATRRRRQSGRLKQDRPGTSSAGLGQPFETMSPEPWNSGARAYLARWGCGPRWLASDAATAGAPMDTRAAPATARSIRVSYASATT